jgi:peptide-methionine (S)-S-oxide reductase
VTSYRDILDVFFTIHDPTTRDRQGNDAGAQYRSAIFFDSDEQRSIAEQAIREIGAARIWDNPIVTEVRPAATFYRAEDYHQEYFNNNPQQPYCTFVVAPKVRKFREKFANKLRRNS